MTIKGAERRQRLSKIRKLYENRSAGSRCCVGLAELAPSMGCSACPARERDYLHARYERDSRCSSDRRTQPLSGAPVVPPGTHVSRVGLLDILCRLARAPVKASAVRQQRTSSLRRVGSTRKPYKVE